MSLESFDQLPNNFEIKTGEDDGAFVISFRVKKTLKNRIKWGLWCLIFPWRISRWDELKKKR